MKLFLILVIAFALRFWGIWWGLPLFPHLDEQTVFSPVLKMLETGNLNPHYFRYPSLYFYFIYLVVLAAKTILGNNILKPENWPTFYLIGRFSTAVISTLTVYLTYRLGKIAFSKTVGLLSAASFSIMFLPIYLSHFMTVDMLALFFLLFSLIFCFRIMTKGDKRDYIWAGILAGLLVGTKFNIGIFIPLLLSYFFSLKMRPFSYLLKTFLAAGLAFLVTNPYLILSFREYIDGFVSQLMLLKGEEVAIMSDKDGIISPVWYIRYWLDSGVGWSLFLTALAGVIISVLRIKNNSRKFWLFISFPIFYLTVIFISHHRGDRYSLPFMPFVAIFSAIFFTDVWTIIKTKVKVPLARLVLFSFFLFVFLSQPAYKAILFDYTISQKDTRLQAAEWLEKNYSKGRLILAVADTIHIGHYLQSKGFQNVINLFPLDPKEIYQYPGEIILIDSFNYQSAKNYQLIEEYKTFWENYQTLKDKSELIHEFSNPLFKKEFFSPSLLEHSSTVNGYHNPTVQVFKIPENQKVPPYERQYLAEDMLNYSSMDLVEDEKATGHQGLLSSSSNEGAIRGPRQPFPRGKYQVIFRVKIQPKRNTGQVGVLGVLDEVRKEILTQRIITEKDFPQAGIYYDFYQTFSLKEGVFITPVIFHTGQEDLWVDTIRIEQKTDGEN